VPWSLWVVQIYPKQIQDGRRPPSWKSKKLRWNRLTDFNEICYADARFLPDPKGRKNRTFKIQYGGRPPAWTSLGWHQRTARRIASHPVVMVLCTKLVAECDRQATVVGRLLTTFGDDRRAVAKLFLVQRLEKKSGVVAFYLYICRASCLHLSVVCARRSLAAILLQGAAK